MTGRQGRRGKQLLDDLKERKGYWKSQTEVSYCSENILWNSLRTCHKIDNGVYLFIKVKVKVTLVQALRLCTGRTAHRGSRGIALLFHDYGTRRGDESASRPGRSLPPGKTWYPLYRRLSALQGRSGQERKISPPLGFDTRTVQSVASRYTD